MRVIGTAGHVDHEKSTLVEALTGIHPDRLKEEREREMTIDLGFAWLKLPKVVNKQALWMYPDTGTSLKTCWPVLGELMLRFL